MTTKKGFDLFEESPFEKKYRLDVPRLGGPI